MPKDRHVHSRVASKDESDRDSYDGRDGGGGVGSCLAALIQTPVTIAAGIIGTGLGLAFLIVGAVYMYQCRAEPMVPIWLMVQGIILLFGIGVGGFAKKKSKDKVSLPIKIVGVIVSLATFIWFIAGNVWVYQTWAKGPDYVHFWFENGCSPVAFRLAFIGIIVLDCLIPIVFVVGIVAFCLRGCKSR
ncbi:hypothetical protein SK128_012427 [Halocaridina rubra]|uniref:Uncharacterized protein n=1 Tax=Halocaridina rubra TaxID=373956 RepID=A0AAN8ZX97_HALRR